MTLPRSTYLANITSRGYDLISKPYDLSPMYDEIIAEVQLAKDGTSVFGYGQIPSGAILLEANFSLTTHGSAMESSTRPTRFAFAFTASSTGESVDCQILFTRGAAHFSCNRANATGGWSNPRFMPTMSRTNISSIAGDTGKWSVEAVIDRSILEIFLNGGVDAGAMTVFPEGRLDRVNVVTEGTEGVLNVRLRIRGLRSGWASGSAEGSGKVGHGNGGKEKAVFEDSREDL